MKLLNLGCGTRFHPDWINVDFSSGTDRVIAHDLMKGIPFGDSEFDVVYHSHVLEHFPRMEGRKFIEECHRVLKPSGVIRIAVPDLEQIVRNYLSSLEGALAGNGAAASNYEWMMLEMYDQAVRNASGGEMASYLCREKLDNENFVFGRVGEEGKQIREKFLASKWNKNTYQYHPKPLWKKLLDPRTYIRGIKNIFFENEVQLNRDNQRLMDIGKFRAGGEIHQWMYDRFSLKKLLTGSGFSDISVTTAFESAIPKWNDFQLESRSGIVYKPDSLFMEARKL